VGGYVALALALASLVAAGCGGTGGALFPRSESRAAERNPEGDAAGAPTSRDGVAAADPLVDVRETLTGGARVARVGQRAAVSVPMPAPRPDKAEDHEPPSKHIARAGPSSTPTATRAAADGAVAEDPDAPDRGSRKKPGVNASVEADDEETGRAGVWILGLLLAGAVTGGGWLALQPGPVRGRILRGVLTAPRRFLARLRGTSARGTTTTTTWSTPSSAWASFSGAGDGAAEDTRTEGVPARRHPTSRRRGNTNVTLPAMRIPVQNAPDAPPADDD